MMIDNEGNASPIYRKRVLALEYIHRAIWLRNHPECQGRGTSYWSLLNGADYAIVSHRHKELKPLALRIRSIRLLWTIDQARCGLCRPCLTTRQRLRLGKLSDIEHQQYQYNTDRHRSRAIEEKERKEKEEQNGIFPVVG